MSNTKFKTPFYLLAGLFILPMVIGTFLFYYHAHFKLKTLNRGGLVNPPIQMRDLGMQFEKQKKWQVVYLPQQCSDGQSEQVMFALHQIRIALNKDSKRVNLNLAVSQNCELSKTHDFQKLLLNQQQFSKLQAVISQKLNHPFVAENKIYLIDPVGNLFMYYPNNANPMDILKDLKRVLEVSQIG